MGKIELFLIKGNRQQSLQRTVLYPRYGNIELEGKSILSQDLTTPLGDN